MDYECPECGILLKKYYIKDQLLHPLKEGLIFKTPSLCSFAGKLFEWPTIEIKELGKL